MTRTTAGRRAGEPSRYQDYLQTPWWRQVRGYILRRADYRCERCRRPDRFDADTWLEVHHLTYQRLGNEYVQDLIVLCNHCHRAEHGTPDLSRPVMDRVGDLVSGVMADCALVNSAPERMLA